MTLERFIEILTIFRDTANEYAVKFANKPEAGSYFQGVVNAYNAVLENLKLVNAIEGDDEK